MGFFVIITGILLLLYVLSNYSYYSWLLVLLYGLMGVQFLLLWILGEYVGRIYDQQKGRPLYVIAQTINILEKIL